MESKLQDVMNLPFIGGISVKNIKSNCATQHEAGNITVSNMTHEERVTSAQGCLCPGHRT